VAAARCYRAAMDEAALAHALRSGAEGAVENLFDSYAARLYHYSLTLLSDPDQAGDAVGNAMLAAVDRAGRRAEVDQLELWLFALARNECVRIRQRAHAAPAGTYPVGGAGPSGTGPESGAGPDSGGTDVDEVAELIHCHALDHRGVAAVLGIPVWRARTLARRSDAVAEGRAGRPCVLPVAVPAALRERVLADAVNPGRTTYRGDLAAPFRRSGFPVPLDQAGRRRRFIMIGAVAAGLLVIGTVHALPLDGRPEVVLSVGEPTAEDVPLPFPAPSSSSSPSASVSPSPSGSATPSPTKSPSASPKPGSPVPKPQPSAPRQFAPPPPPISPTGQIIGIGGDCVEVVVGGGIELLKCDGGSAQRWSVVSDGTLRAFGQCMGPQNGRADDATPVVLASCDGSSAQRWQARGDGSLLNEGSGRCLDGPNNPSNPKQLEIWHCTGGAYQRWWLPR